VNFAVFKMRVVTLETAKIHGQLSGGWDPP
jgi:hypothetical protein